MMKKLTMYYDGLCPLCQAEILFLSGRNQAGLLHFVDVNSSQYSEGLVGVSCQKALDSMSAQYDDGELINGVDVFCAAYERANLPKLAWLFSLPGLHSPELSNFVKYFVIYSFHLQMLVLSSLAKFVYPINNC
jgi:predicted DCC family thiol-disulfide oxidoreductase YuxK